MVATFTVNLDTGGADGGSGITETDTDVLGPPNIRFKRADDPTIDNNNPDTIPTAGTTFSRWKSIYLKCVNPPDTQVDNIVVFTDGTGFGTGITVNSVDDTVARTNASQSAYLVSDTDDETITSAFSSTVTDFFTFITGSGKTIGISEAGNIIDATLETSNYLILQMEIINTASPGNLADETITYEYDEI